ncbi:MAG: GAF domain-containing protein [Hydrogenibacillus sp.]|nr:GAF domain-containing protein [Hydrogenibacillus sp.]
MRESSAGLSVAQIVSEAMELLEPWMKEGLEPLLQAVVDYARKMVGASFAALIILDPGDPSAIRYFKVSGWSLKPAEFPKGHGMYILSAKTGRSLRIESIARHPLSIGVPKNHPPVEALLSIPLKYRGRPIGCVFFGKAPNEGAFTQHDEEIMNGFASMCAIAISWIYQREDNRLNIVVEERRRIAEELHDSLSQTLFAVAREIDALERALPTAEEKDAVRARIERLRELAVQCQSELRAILFRLMNDEVQPSAAALNHLVQKFERLSGIAIHLATRGPFEHLSLPIRQAILKIVAESLTNVYRHANSPVALVHVFVDEEKVVVTVQDAGIGISDAALRFMSHPSGHFGLHSMARTVAEFKGELEVFRNEDGGTTVRCTLPTHPGPRS